MCRTSTIYKLKIIKGKQVNDCRHEAGIAVTHLTRVITD